MRFGGRLDRRRFDDPFIQQALDQIRLANDGDRPRALGRIAPGAKADFLLIDLKHSAMQPVYDPLRNLLHCAAERAVDAVYVDGRPVVEGGKVLHLDYDGALAELQDAQDFAVKHLQANDPGGRPSNVLARKSLPAM